MTSKQYDPADPSILLVVVAIPGILLVTFLLNRFEKNQIIRSVKEKIERIDIACEKQNTVQRSVRSS